MPMGLELKQEKRERLMIALRKLIELHQAEPAGDALAHERAAANHLTTTAGISRPLSDRYVAVANAARTAGARADTSAEATFPDDVLPRITTLDDKFGAAFMVLPHHVEQILKGGKHMSRRFRKWGDEGDTFHVKGKAFRFTKVTRLRVGDITDEDIRKEGYATREEFDGMWVKSHPKSVAAGKKLNPDDLCWCHEYEPA
jgi:N4-acetylcytidine amidohydrolase